MKVPLLTLLISLIGASPLSAQWLNHPTPGLPRTQDGRPDLSSPAPRAPDGKPDLSGIWRLDGLGYTFNIFGTQKVEMMPWARELHTTRALGFAKDSPDTNCLPAGPRAGLFGMSPVKFVQTNGLLLILYEDAPTRQVFLDGRTLPEDPNPTWMGYSVGHWEDDTLVVESAGFNDRTWLDLSGRPHTEALRVTERFRRLDVGRMRLDMTFDDPKAYARPWTIGVDVQLFPDTELLENVCNENEKDRHRLVGRLEDEHAQKVTVPAAILERYVGTYAAGPLGKIRVVTQGDALAIELSGGGGLHPAFAKSELEFLVPDVGVPIKFLKNARGEVTHLRLTSVEGDFDAPRLPDHGQPH
jgi:uncharacterized protein DUF3471